MWNLVQLANAIYPLIDAVKPLQDCLTSYTDEFEYGWQAMMLQKLGLKAADSASDQALIQELLALLQTEETDMTLFFRNLAKIPVSEHCLENITNDALILPIQDAFYQHEQLQNEYKNRMGNWLHGYVKRLQHEGLSAATRSTQMNTVNPKFVLRNYLAQQAIDKAERGDYSKINELMEVLKKPYEEQPGKEKLANKRPDWARQKPGCSMLSCSS
jgi:uncharacterized protein YdiU (UPF0061 family)